MSPALQRVPLQINKNYVPSGIKSYAWLLNKCMGSPKSLLFTFRSLNPWTTEIPLSNDGFLHKPTIIWKSTSLYFYIFHHRVTNPRQTAWTPQNGAHSTVLSLTKRPRTLLCTRSHISGFSVPRSTLWAVLWKELQLMMEDVTSPQKTFKRILCICLKLSSRGKNSPFSLTLTLDPLTYG